MSNPTTLLKFLNLITISVFLIHLNAHAQPKPDSLAGMQDPFLDNLVGKWSVQSVAHGFSSTATIEAKWVMAHQHLQVHFTGNEPIPWLKIPMEFEYYIGYKHSAGKYIVHGISVFGDDDFEGFCYAYRHGDNLDLVQIQNEVKDSVVVQRFHWDAANHNWLIRSWMESSMKTGEVFLSMQLQRKD